ncbi:DUF445 family protein [Staphylococcus sp. Marseille-Q5304]|uniref:DUF445 domain-containing protein n=1 Tax=Staphylococcus sp. Marseille-Q5304 TaxID=2942200 RepID=UPI002072B8A8|nr:DUF445 family protein [Staphylococcus sp. Marseille-Q5304]
MTAILLVVFMMIIGAIIGGVTNVIAIRMLFHPYKAYYIFNKRLPFTPGLIPKRRDEVASKIGQVVEEHLLTESLIKSKLNAPSSREAIEDLLLKQISKLKQDHVTISYLTEELNIDLDQVSSQHLHPFISSKLSSFYENHRSATIASIIPNEIEKVLDSKSEQVPDLLFDRARVYLKSEKGAHDISSMLDTFFQEKGRIVGLLQMFMTKESIAERIQHELIRLTSHPKAKKIAKQIIDNEYQTLKSKKLEEVVSETQFESFKASSTDLIMGYLELDKTTQQPLNKLMPGFINFLEQRVVSKATNIIIDRASEHLTPIMKKINLRQMIEEQINTFELDYIERLIIGIANKELKLITFLGFLLGGIIGLLQGVIAIFV